MLKLFFFLALPVLAGTTVPEETNYYYLEAVPKHKTVMEFEFPQCNLDSKLLTFQRVNSLQEIQHKKVRTIILRGQLSGMHKKCSGKVSKTSLILEVEAHAHHMTHIYVIVDREVIATKIEGK